MTMDEVETLRLINLYGVAIDSQRWDLLGEIFTEDAVADYGDGFVFRGLDAFKKGAAMAWGRFEATQHAMSSTAWRLREKSGHTLTYGAWFIRQRGVKGGDVWEGKGWYDDEWVRGDAGWRIKHRSCRVMSWTGNARIMLGDAADEMEMRTYSLKDATNAGTLGFFKG